MKLTCVTAAFNCIKSGNCENLVRCVKSVAQLKITHEHLIYDGASSDGTAELLVDLARITPGLKVVSEPDTGIYNALNKGLCDAKGEWFYVLGADDYIISENNLLSAISCGEKQCADVIAAPVYISDDKTQILVCNKRIIGSMPYPHQGMLIKTVIARGLHGFDEKFRIAADYDILLRAMLVGVKIVLQMEAFAFFCPFGFSAANKDLSAENLAIVAKNLGLKKEDAIYYAKKNLLPLGKCLGLLFHKSSAIKFAAKYYLIRWIANLIGLVRPNGVMVWRR